MLTSTMLEYLFQSNGSPAAIILSYGQIQTHHIDRPSSPSALDSLVSAEALNKREGQKHEGS